MEGIKDNPLQSRFEGDIFNVKTIKPARVLQPVLTGAEQVNLIDERIKKEIPELRIVKKGQAILVPTQSTGRFTRVFLEQDAILARQRQKEYPKRFNYYLRIPVLVSSVEYGNKWQVKHGLVDTFGKSRKISQKLIPEVILKLRNYTKLA